MSTTADANGSYFLRTPPGVQGFVRCHPPGADNLVLTRFVRARRPGERLMGQDVTPATTVISRVVTQAIRAGLDPVLIQDALLASIAPLTILLPDHPNGNGMFATVQLTSDATLSNPDLALLVFTATAIFDAMRQQRTNIPANITFAAALTDYFQDAAFQPALTPLAPAVNTAVDQGQAVLGLGRSDISAAASTATLRGTVTDPDGAPLAGVLVVATQKGASVGTATTDASGAFALADVPPGSTIVTASLGLAGTSVTLTVIAVPLFPLNLALTPTSHPQLFVSSRDTNAVLRYDGQTGAFLNVFAPPAENISLPHGLVFGLDGNLYVSSTATDAILRYDGRTGAFRDIFVPRGSGGLAAPAGLVFGPDGHLYVTSVGTNAVLRYDGRTGAFLNAFVPSDSDGLACPIDLVFGPDGHLYVISSPFTSFPLCNGAGPNGSGRSGVLRYDGRTGAFLDFFVSQGRFSSSLFLSGLAFGPDGNLYVSDSGKISRFNGQTGAFLSDVVTQGAPGSGGLALPRQLVFGSDGHLYVINLSFASSGSGTLASAQILRFDGQTGTFLNTFVPSGSGGLACFIGGLVFGPDSHLYVISNPIQGSLGPNSGQSCPGTFGVLRYDGRTGTFLNAFVLPTSIGLAAPQGLVLGPDGHLYVASSGTSAILRYDGQTGAFLGAFVSSGSGGLANPTGLVFGADGNLYASSGTGAILRYDGQTGAFLGAFVPRGSGGLTEPQGLVFGPDGNLYTGNLLTDRSDSTGGAFGGEILRYDGRTGTFRDVFVPDRSGGLKGPKGLVFGPDGHLYVTNTTFNVVFGDFSSFDVAEILRYDGQSGVFLDVFVPRGSGGLSGSRGPVFLIPQ